MILQKKRKETQIHKCRRPEVLTIVDIKEITIYTSEGRLFESVWYCRILSVEVSFSVWMNEF